MYVDSLQLIKFRQELVNGGITSEEAFEIVQTYYDAKIGERQNDGEVYLVNEQDASELAKLKRYDSE